ncbi:hypothetical protein Bcep1808_2675 [Burkholderia vietnamiensis G4]|uniref:Uncharacterized protein n=1 Tax=Burkholderia vietnamiensis (strain G4 / LMG 22486) TaxID=269482 RepID=A4JHB4_BURVG|nr:hypothetical protein Bcep1808_2675 [Burkholderia vietnamiensis G4]
MKQVQRTSFMNKHKGKRLTTKISLFYFPIKPYINQASEYFMKSHYFLKESACSLLFYRNNFILSRKRYIQCIDKVNYFSKVVLSNGEI